MSAGPATPGTKTVLLVEDEPALQRIFGTVLEDAGHHVVCVGSAEDAMVHLKASPGAADLVLADKNLPGETGIQLLQRVRSMDAAQGTERAFVMVTGYPSRDSLHVALTEAAEAYLVKPFASLRAAVDELNTILGTNLAPRRRAHRYARRVADALSTGLPASERCVVKVGDPDLDAALTRALGAGRVMQRSEAEVMLSDDIDVLITVARDAPHLGRCFISPAATFDDLMTLVNLGGAICDPTTLLLTGRAA